MDAGIDQQFASGTEVGIASVLWVFWSLLVFEARWRPCWSAQLARGQHTFVQPSARG